MGRGPAKLGTGIYEHSRVRRPSVSVVRERDNGAHGDHIRTLYTVVDLRGMNRSVMSARQLVSPVIMMMAYFSRVVLYDARRTENTVPIIETC